MLYWLELMLYLSKDRIIVLTKTQRVMKFSKRELFTMNFKKERNWLMYP
jgi:hypothetical protein